MPIIASAIKRVQTSEKARLRNVAVRTTVRKKTKALMTTIEAKDAAKAQTTLTEALSQIDRAAKRGVLHKNTAARRKSQLTLAYNSISKTAFGTSTATKSATTKSATKPPAAKATKTPTKK